MRTPVLLLVSVAFASAQSEFAELRRAASQAVIETGVDAAEPYWIRIETSLPALVPDSMEHASLAGWLADDLVFAGQDIRGFRVVDEAMSRMAHLAVGHPAVLKLLGWKADILRKSSRHLKAVGVRERIVNAHSGLDSRPLHQAKYELAYEYRMVEQHEKAVPVLRELSHLGAAGLKADPNLMLADSLLELRRFAEAGILIRERIEQAGSDDARAEWRSMLARMHYEEGREGAERVRPGNLSLLQYFCRSRKILEELGISRLPGHLAASAEFSGHARLTRIADVVSAVHRLSESQASALGPLIESSAAALEKAHLLGRPHKIDPMWGDLIKTARRGGTMSTAERLGLGQVELIEKYRGKDSLTLDRPKEILVAIRRGEPLP